MHIFCVACTNIQPMDRNKKKCMLWPLSHTHTQTLTTKRKKCATMSRWLHAYYAPWQIWHNSCIWVQKLYMQFPISIRHFIFGLWYMFFLLLLVVYILFRLRFFLFYPLGLFVSFACGLTHWESNRDQILMMLNQWKDEPTNSTNFLNGMESIAIDL